MNLLIIGGLLAVGIVAILIAILLGIGEQRAEAARAAKLPPAQSALPQRSEASVSRPTETQSTSRPTTKLNTSSLDTSVVDDTNVVPRGEKQLLPVLNGQFRELVGEIRTLHRQAQQLEQRLSLLEVMVDHIDHEQAERGHGGTDIGEEATSLTDDSLA